MDAVKWMSQGEMCVVPRRGSYSGPIGAPLITPLFPELQVARDQTFERQPRLLAERNLKLSNGGSNALHDFDGIAASEDGSFEMIQI